MLAPPVAVPWIDRWGSDPWSWNVEDDDESEGDGSGRPGRGLVGSALLLWADRSPGSSIDEAAACFNLHPSFVADALRSDMFEACDLAEAVQTWSLCRGDACSLSMAAVVFGVSLSDVLAAIGSHCWMLVEMRGGVLCVGHEGE